VIEVLGMALGVLALRAILYFTGYDKKLGIGASLLVALSAFLLLTFGFQMISQMLTTAGYTVIGGQVDKAGIYIGYTLAGVCAIVSAIIIALKVILAR
jgi:hypothetical protein